MHDHQPLRGAAMSLQLGRRYAAGAGQDDLVGACRGIEFFQDASLKHWLLRDVLLHHIGGTCRLRRAPHKAKVLKGRSVAGCETQCVEWWPSGADEVAGPFFGAVSAVVGDDVHPTGEE